MSDDPNEAYLRLSRELEYAYQVLSLYGVPKDRARTVGNGIEVLVTRLRKEIAGYEVVHASDVQIITQLTHERDGWRERAAEYKANWEQAENDDRGVL